MGWALSRAFAARLFAAAVLLTAACAPWHGVRAVTFSVKPSAIVTTILASPTTSCSGAVAYPSSSNCPLKDGGIPTLSYGTVNGATSAVPYLAYTMTTAAQARRFCVSSLQWTFWYVSGNNVFTSDPAEDTTSAGWTMTTLNYNNAATLAPIQSSFSQPTINIIAGQWNTMTFPSSAISAINQNIAFNGGIVRSFAEPYKYSWRMNRYGTGTADRIFRADVASGTYAPYVSGTYTLCDANALCDTTTNSCKCASNYYGTGSSSCAIATCATSTVSGITYSGVNAGVSSTGDCPTGFVGAATRTCVQSTTCTPSTGTNGCPTGTFADSTLVYNCQQLLCTAPSGIEYNARYNASVAIGGVMTGYCDTATGYTGTITRPCTQTGAGVSAVGVLGAPTGGGACTVVSCPAITAAAANWPATPTGGSAKVVASTCNEGYASPTVDAPPARTCYVNGTWADTIGNACARVQCAARAADPATGAAAYPNVEWSPTPTQGTCPAGYIYAAAGPATRVCTSTGAWAAETNPCVRVQCPAVASDFASGTAAYAATDAPSAVALAGTCPAGWTGAPTRNCTLAADQLTAAWTADTPPCVPLTCPALGDDNNAAWPQANAGASSIAGTCNVGYVQTPAPQRACLLNATWDTQIVNRCAVAFCPGVQYQQASWALTIAGGSAFGNCSLGYRVSDAGPPGRACLLNGTWADTVSNPCVARVCAGVHEAFANWTDTVAATTDVNPAPTFGVCDDGFQGNPSRVCTGNGTWSGITDACIPNVCVGQPDCVLNCTARIEFNAAWPAAASFTNAVVGTCIAGWAGTPQRPCGQYGAWQAPTSGTPACAQLSCPALVDPTATWPAALSGTAAVTGTCSIGYRIAADGTAAPTRQCTTVCNSTTDSSSGACAWAANVTSPCEQIFCAPLTASALADWPATAAGTVAAGTCIAGYTGVPTRPCNLDGSWGALTAACTQLVCPLTTSQPDADDPTAFWPPTLAGTAAVAGTCKTLYGVAAGAAGPPTRACQLSGAWDAAVTNPCVRLTCPAVSDGLASFATALSGSAQVFGACPEGFAGAPQRSCNDVGVWSNTTGTCVQRVCGAETVFSATWPAGTVAGAVATGACLAGYAAPVAAPTRLCQLDGTWAANLTAGECTQLFCIVLNEGNALWPATPAGSSVQGTCETTYSGSVQRSCRIDASWSTVTGSCVAVYCPALATVNGTSFPATRAGTTASGTCLNAFYAGSPTLACSETGTWAATIGTPCLPIASTCAADFNFQNAIWPETAAGSASFGSCLAGFASTSTPTRQCLRIDGAAAGDNPYGVWVNTTVANPCLFQAGYDGAGVRLTNLTVASATSSSLTLSWTPLAGANVFYVSYSSNALTFFSSGPPVVDASSLVISNLAEHTTYQFRIVPADADSTDTLGAGVAGTTFIKPPSNFTVASYGATALTLRWGKGSDLTSAFRLYYAAAGSVGGRAASSPGDEYTLALNQTNATSYTVGGLAASTTYTFQLRALAADGTEEEVGATLLTRTDASAEGLGAASVPVIAGVAAGAIVVLLVIVIAGYVVHRRQLAKKQRELLVAYNSQVAMLTIGRTNESLVSSTPSFFDMNTINPAMLRANLQVPSTLFTDANATMLNTVMEYSMPGYLLMDYSMGLRPESRLTAGGAGTIFSATLLDLAAIQRNGGTERCAIKLVQDWPSLRDEDNAERFGNEISIMWSLAFHPNVVKLIGYTEEPRTIVTRLYPTDLFRYLHAQENKDPLDPHLMLHLAAGIVSAVATMHSIGVAHRDLKSPNVLLQEPKAGSPYPDAILCDFGISRTNDELTTNLHAVRGISPRYASPEAFARLKLRHSTNTLEDDKMSDVYSVGVVVWELVTRMVPWEGQSNIEVEQNIRFGMRLPELEVADDDPILRTLNDIINGALQTTPMQRPTSIAINSQLAALIRSLIAAPVVPTSSW